MSGKTYLTSMNAYTTLSAKGQIVIPKPTRERLRMLPGQRFEVVETPEGVLLKRLEEIGELDNTLIVVSGDHGAPAFPHGKCNLYDFGSSVSLAMRWGGAKGGRVVLACSGWRRGSSPQGVRSPIPIIPNCRAAAFARCA